MTDRFIGREPGLDGPAVHGFSITPNNDTALPEVSRALYVGTAGDLAVMLASGSSVTLINVAAGTLLPLRAGHRHDRHSHCGAGLMVGLGIGIGGMARRPWWPAGADYALDFVGNRYMVNGAEVPASSAFTFTRATPAAMADGQGNWRSFPAGSLRRISGIGARIEPAATNLVRASEDIGGPGWTSPPPQLTRSGDASAGWQFTVNAAYSGFLMVEQSFPAIAGQS